MATQMLLRRVLQQQQQQQGLKSTLLKMIPFRAISQQSISFDPAEGETKLASHILRDKFVGIEGQSFFCKDSRGDEENFGAAAGDFGEFLLALDCFKKMLTGSISSSTSVHELFEKWLVYANCSPQRPFYLHTDRLALTKIFSKMNRPDLKDPIELSNDLRAQNRFLEVLLSESGEFQGCGHLRLLMATDSNEYEIDAALLEQLTTAYFRFYWAKDLRIKYKIYESLQNGKAVAIIIQNDEQTPTTLNTQNTHNTHNTHNTLSTHNTHNTHNTLSTPSTNTTSTTTPLTTTNDSSPCSVLSIQSCGQNDQIFILNQHAVTLYRKHFLVPFFVNAANGSIDSGALFDCIERKGWKNAMKTAQVLAEGKPIYKVFGVIFVIFLSILASNRLAILGKLYENATLSPMELTHGFFTSEGCEASFDFELGTGSMNCLEAHRYTLLRGGQAFLAKNAKRISYSTFNVLWACGIVTDALEEVLAEFQDWQLLKNHCPAVFASALQTVDLNAMSSHALAEIPHTDLLAKLLQEHEKRHRILPKLLNKLPLDRIVSNLNPDLISQYWPIFDQFFFARLNNFRPQMFLLEFLLNYKDSCIKSDQDRLVWSMQIENIIIMKISLLGSKKYTQIKDIFKRIDIYNTVEELINRILKSQKLVNFPASNRFKMALQAVLVDPTDASCPLRAGLSLQRPIDENVDVYGSTVDHEDFCTSLDNLVRVILPFAKINFEEEASPFPEIVSKYSLYGRSHTFLEALKFFSNSETEVVFHFEAVHSIDQLSQPLSSTLMDWVLVALQMSSENALKLLYSIFKYYPTHTAQLISLINRFKHISKDLKGLFQAVISTEPSSSSSLAIQFALLVPHLRLDFGEEQKKTILEVEFIDSAEALLLVLDGFELATIHPPSPYSQITQSKQFKDFLLEHKASAASKLSHNQKIMRFLRSSFAFFHSHRETLKGTQLFVKFTEMPGTDNGGLARHFLSVLFKILLEKEFNLFLVGGSDSVYPRVLLDARIMSFLGALHGQALKLGLKAPWIPNFDITSHPKRIKDIISELYKTDEDDTPFEVPKIDSIISRLSPQNIFSQKAKRVFEKLPTTKITTDKELSEYFGKLECLEMTFWYRGMEEYRIALLSGLDPQIVSSNQDQVFQSSIKLLQPVNSSEIEIEEFIKFLTFQGCARDLAQRAFKGALEASSSQSLIPELLRFATGTHEIPPGGLSSLNLQVKTTFSNEPVRFPRASTCTNTVIWDVPRDRSIDDLSALLTQALFESRDFSLK